MLRRRPQVKKEITKATLARTQQTSAKKKPAKKKAAKKPAKKKAKKPKKKAKKKKKKKKKKAKKLKYPGGKRPKGAHKSKAKSASAKKVALAMKKKGVGLFATTFGGVPASSDELPAPSSGVLSRLLRDLRGKEIVLERRWPPSLSGFERRRVATDSLSRAGGGCGGSAAGAAGCSTACVGKRGPIRLTTPKYPASAADELLTRLCHRLPVCCRLIPLLPVRHALYSLSLKILRLMGVEAPLTVSAA